MLKYTKLLRHEVAQGCQDVGQELDVHAVQAQVEGLDALRGQEERDVFPVF